MKRMTHKAAGMAAVLVTAVAMATMALSACAVTLIVPSTTLKSETVTATGFDTINVSSAVNVVVSAGDAYSVQLTANENLIDYVTVKTEGTALVASMDTSVIMGSPNITLSVTMPASALKSVSASSASSVSLQALSLGDLSLSLSSAASASASGSSCGTLTLIASSASSAKLSDLSAVNSVVTVSSASSAQVRVSGSLSGSATSASSIEYYGDPSRNVTVDTSSSCHRAY